MDPQFIDASRVDLVDYEILKGLRESGCFRIWYGAESGSQKVLDSMRKGTTVAQVRKAAQVVLEVGVKYLFLLHSPADAPEQGTPEAARMYADYSAALQVMDKGEGLLPGTAVKELLGAPEGPPPPWAAAQRLPQHHQQCRQDGD